MDILVNIKTKIRTGKYFFKKCTNPTVKVTLQPGLQKAFQMTRASVVACWQSKWIKT